VLILVRHGRTAANAQGRLQGRLDLPLDDVGREQADRLARAVGRADRIVSSPLRRARETAAAFGTPVEIDERWIEQDYGEFDGRLQREIPVAEWQRWRADPSLRIGGGESLDDLQQRVTVALDDLAGLAEHERVVVVSHVSPIKAAVAWSLGTGVEIAWRCQLDQASITTVAIGPRGPSLRTFNETGHLA